jgi:molybdopterin/thiamine biosynthesis adenylyltransferase
VPTGREAGVIGAMAGVIGCMQALEAVKYIVGVGDLLIGRLLTFDALDMEAHVIQLPDNPDCPVCGAHPTILQPFDEGVVECDLK